MYNKCSRDDLKTNGEMGTGHVQTLHLFVLTIEGGFWYLLRILEWIPPKHFGMMHLYP